MKGSRAWLGLGGNLGDPASAMARALRMIDADPQCRVIKVSSLYRTPPWGRTDQPDFLNAVAEICTLRRPRDLLALCMEVEKRHKRVRAERWGPRTIDIDILAYDGKTMREAGLQVPHPHIAERAFVLVPLAEIAPELAVAGKKVEELLLGMDRAGIAPVTSGPDWWRG